MSSHHGNFRRGALITLTAVVPVLLAASAWWLGTTDGFGPAAETSAGYGERAGDRDETSDEPGDELTGSTKAPSPTAGDREVSPTATQRSGPTDRAQPTQGPDREGRDDRRTEPDPEPPDDPEPTDLAEPTEDPDPPDPTDAPDPPDPPPSEDPRPQPTGERPTPRPTDDDDDDGRWPWPWLRYAA